VQMDGQSLEQR